MACRIVFKASGPNFITCVWPHMFERDGIDNLIDTGSVVGLSFFRW